MAVIGGVVKTDRILRRNRRHQLLRQYIRQLKEDGLWSDEDRRGLEGKVPINIAGELGSVPGLILLLFLRISEDVREMAGIFQKRYGVNRGGY